MKISTLAVRRPVTVAMCVVAVLIFGFLSFQRIGLELLPNLKFPVAAIATVYPSADPKTVEGEVTKPLEGAIASVSGLKRLQSMSMENVSVILAEFDWGTNLQEALDRVDANIAALRSTLPQDSQKPLVLPLDPTQFPLMTVGVTGTDLADVTQTVEEVVRPQLERVDGVAEVSVLGGTHKELHVLYDSDKLRANELDPYLVQQLLTYQNMVIPAGTIVEKGVRYNVRVGSRFNSIEDLKNQVLSADKTTGGEAFGLGLLVPRLIRVKDVADVVEVNQSPEGATRVNGKPAVVLRILKQSGRNTVLVARDVARALQNIEVANKDLEISIITNQADFIRRSLSNLAKTGLVGALLAVGVLFLFIGSWSSIAVIATAIPLSIIVTVALMYFGGLTLNLMTLGGLALGVGMFVDNAIVVLENIYRHRMTGSSPEIAAQQGSEEIAGAITTSTLTTLAVFIPMIFIKSIAGHLFKELGITVSLALAASLVVALTVVPMLSSQLLKRSGRRPSFRESTGSNPGSLGNSYTRTLRWSVRRPLVSLGILGLLVLVSMVVPAYLQSEFLPTMDGGMVDLDVRVTPGTPVEKTLDTVKQVENVLSKTPEVALVSSQVGQQGQDDFMSVLNGTPSNEGRVTAVLTPGSERHRSATQIAQALGSELKSIDNAKIGIKDDRVVDALGSWFAGGINIEVTGPDLTVLEDLVGQVAQQLQAAGGISDIRTSVRDQQPEILFQVNQGKALQGYMTSGTIGLGLRNALVGAKATTVRQNGHTVPVILKPKTDEIRNVDTLLNLRLTSPVALNGERKRAWLTQVVTPSFQQGPRTIQHVDRQRVVTLTAALDGIDLGEGGRRARKILQNVNFPAGYQANLVGIHQVLDETKTDMTLALVLAVLLVYMVMAARFESLVHPFLIMLTVPLATAGGMAALFLTGHKLGVPAYVGLIMLTGIAVNNGIVLVDYTNLLRAQGVDLDEAIVTAASARLRPILMTAITTILGLSPLVFDLGEGTEIQVPMAITVIGGLITSTVLTLFVIPAFYRFVSKRGSGSHTVGKTVSYMVLAAAVVGALTFPTVARASAKELDMDLLAGVNLRPESASTYTLGTEFTSRSRNGEVSFRASGSLPVGRIQDTVYTMGLRSSWQKRGFFGPSYQLSSALYYRFHGDTRRYYGDVNAAAVIGNYRGGFDFSYTESGYRTLLLDPQPMPLQNTAADETHYRLTAYFEHRLPNSKVWWERDMRWYQETATDTGRRVLISSGPKVKYGNSEFTAKAGLVLDKASYRVLWEAGYLVRPSKNSEWSLQLVTSTLLEDWPEISSYYTFTGNKLQFSAMMQLGLTQDGTALPRVGASVSPNKGPLNYNLGYSNDTGLILGLSTRF